VISTLNVQHLESLHMAEHRIAGTWPCDGGGGPSAYREESAADRLAARPGLRADTIMAVAIVDRETLDLVQQKRLRENLTLADEPRHRRSEIDEMAHDLTAPRIRGRWPSRVDAEQA
jgi:hypothetical protein